MLDAIYSDCEQRMKGALAALKDEMAKHRTGRANPSLLDGVMVNYYGSPTPLSQVASVSVESAMVLAIKPWEKKIIPDIEKAIMAANLGLNPATHNDVVRVPMPPLTEERRKDIIKLVRAETEAARVAVRNVRRDANSKVKDLLKAQSITEDEEKRAHDRIQKITDQLIQQIDASLSEKEADLMRV